MSRELSQAHIVRIGYFELVSGGTFFLDEIANLSLSTQRKLLRSVQERSIYPVGSARAVSVDVRLIAASSTMLTTQVEAGCFRSDLFYRLGEFIIYVVATNLFSPSRGACAAKRRVVS